MKRRFGRIGILVLAATCAAGWSVPLGAAERFIDSDDYRDGDEVVGRFFTDVDYAKLVEELEHRDVSFDWGWVKATGKRPNRPQVFGFSLSSYRTIHVPQVVNVSGKVAIGIEGEVHQVLVEATRHLGLELVDDPASADLELSAAIVDYKADRTFIWVGSVDPFIELEIRLHDRRAGEDLLLVRHQDHNNTPALGAADTASDLVQFLRSF